MFKKFLPTKKSECFKFHTHIFILLNTSEGFFLDKFAILDYVKNKSEIPIKFNILRKAPDFIWDWYVKKFNPILIEKLNFDFADGFLIKLPLEKTKIDEKKFLHSLSLAIKSLPQIKIIKLPRTDIEINIPIAHGNFLFAFLMINVIKKFFAITEKNLGQLEIFILDQNYLLTQILIDVIYPHVNYLTIITDTKEIYTQKQHDIFSDVGLNIQIINYNKLYMKNADVIINTGMDCDFAHALGKKILYFDLTTRNDYFMNFKTKRPDIFALNNLNLYCLNANFDSILLEMCLFCISSDFKKIFDGVYNKKIFENVMKKLETLYIKISSFQKN